MAFSITATAQIYDAEIVGKHFLLNPLLRSAFKKPVKTNPLLAERIKPAKYELMYWPNYPLTAAQIAARDQKYNKPIGQQIAGEIIESTINTILYGKKKPPATIPKF